MRDIHDAPPPFNPHYRPGFGEAIGKAYAEWSNSHPEHTREEGVKAHREICERLEPQFPSAAELGIVAKFWSDDK